MDEQHNPLKSELKFLERLSMEELEALLKLSGDPDDVELLFDTVVEEVVAREKENPTGRLPDVDAAWDELQMMYHNMPDEGALLPSALEGPASVPSVGDGPALLAEPTVDKPRRFSFQRVGRTIAVMAAAVVLCMALMVGAQAAGADVFGALARWTDDTFHFETRSVQLDNNSKLYGSIQESLDMQDIFGRYSPKWFPEGSIISDVQTFRDDFGCSVQISLLGGGGEKFFIGIDRYNQSDYIDPLTFEIEAGSVEEYLSHGRTYFIFTNSEMITAVYNNGIIVHRIWGELTVQEMKYMLNSIGG